MTTTPEFVGIFDNNYNQLCKDARAIRASVKPRAKLMRHTVENGATVSDFRVIEPLSIVLSIILLPSTFDDTFSEIENIFYGNNTFIVQTKTATYKSMMLEEMPSEENTEHFNTVTMNLTFTQVVFVTTSTTNLPVSAASTKNPGNKTGLPANASQTAEATAKVQKSSAAYSLFYGK